MGYGSGVNCSDISGSGLALEMKKVSRVLFQLTDLLLH